MRRLDLVITDFQWPGGSDLPLPRLPALEALLARGRRVVADEPGWRHWLLAAAGFEFDRRLPLARTIAGRDGHWALATPVCLVAGIERVHLHPAGIVRLDPEERAALAAGFSSVFGDEGLAIEFVEGTALLSLPRALDAHTHDPEAALGRHAADVMPGGPDGPWLRRLTTEMQMWLHEHPVNLSREARGELVANALWIWGVGEGRLEPGPAAPAPLAAEDAFLRAAWGRAGVAALSPPPSLEGLLELAPTGGAVALSLATLAAEPAEALTRLEERWFAPLVRALGGGGLDCARLWLAGTTVTCRPADRLRFWRARRPWNQVVA